MSHSPPTETCPALEMHRVSVGSMRDQATAVVEDVDWTVAVGDFWVLAGIQGSGKSDFLFLAGGLMPPLSGTYRFFGSEMPIFEENRLPERLRLGLVFEGGQLFNHLTVAENIALPLRYHRNLSAAEAETQVREIMNLTELSPWADSTPGALGRNWQKRVGLARALMLKPQVLLLDNPLGGLDLRHRGWWLRCLDQLSAGHEWLGKNRVTLIATADDLRPWRKRARQFAFLKDKRLIVLGSWDEVEAATDAQLQELLASGAQSS